MKRSFIDGNGKKPDKWVFLAESLDDREILNRFYDMRENRDDPNCCKACIGSGLSSKGRACIPCRGSGLIPPQGHPPLTETSKVKANRLTKVISGGQTGADIAGLDAALECGLKTGGMMPAGYLTLDGNKPAYRKKYGMVEHASSTYPPRTFANVSSSDGTIRLAFDFETRGEILTLKAIIDLGKPSFDVNLSDPPPINAAVSFLKRYNIETLNVAGNAEQHHAGTYAATKEYLIRVFKAAAKS